MFDKLEEVAERHRAITERLSQPDLKPADLLKLGKERAQLDPVVEAFDLFRAKVQERDDNKTLLDEDDAEMRAMAREEVDRLDGEIETLESQLKILLLPRDPNDEKDVILEIRAGTGGDEASLFAGELFEMYARYAANQGWRMDILSSSEGTRGGFKEVVASVSGDQVYSKLKYEAGVHRVQRVPETESQGRIHTSAVTVAILPEAEDVEVNIADKDVRVDVYRASGPGGQSVNTTDSAVRLTHLPTGIVVQCQDEKSQTKNKAKAMKVLRARIFDRMQEELHRERAEERKSMVKSGDRSEKIRTYNFPQDRCTDHRVGLTQHNLPKLFAGGLDDLLGSIHAHFQAELLKGQENQP
jgi:peptide chain release factor 1